MSHFIAIEGVIGVGKTTLARYLQNELDSTLILERFDENPFLSNFYEDRDLYAFQTQAFFLLSRYQQLSHLEHLPHPIVSDYMFAKDYIFAKLNVKGDELAIYEGIFQALDDKIPTPDLVIYLRSTTDTLMKRIAHRDRPYERDMDRNYIESLRAAYEDYFNGFTDAPLLVIDTDSINIVENEQDRFHLLERIRRKLSENQARAKQVPSPVPFIELTSDIDPTAADIEQSTRRLPDFQAFHRYLDAEKGFNTDLLLNMVKLQEEVGELSRAVAKHWSGLQRGEGEIARHALQGELSDVLAYILKIANYTGIDLEEAYITKMAVNRQRHWKSPEGN